MKQNTYYVHLVLLMMLSLPVACTDNQSASKSDTPTAKVETAAGDPLLFPKDAFTEETMTVKTPEGERRVTYRSYKNILYVSKPVDPDYQSMNVKVPVKINDVAVDAANAPILIGLQIYSFLPHKIDDAIKHKMIQADLALAEGYVVVQPAVRGRTNVTNDGVYYGKAPACIVDMKAAIRYIRHNKGVIPGNPDWIITRGGSAGGGSSAVLGASGNSPLFEPYLEEIGAAREDDSVFASICFSSMTDLDNGDPQYEWMYGAAPISKRRGSPPKGESGGEGTGQVENIFIKTTDGSEHLGQQWSYDENPYISKYEPRTAEDHEYVDRELSRTIAASFADYLASLNLQGRDGFGPLTTDNYDEYLMKYYLVPSANSYLRSLTAEKRDAYLSSRSWIQWDDDSGTTFTWRDYLHYVGRDENMPVLDRFDLGSHENGLFGSETVDRRHFTDFSLQYATGDSNAKVDEALKKIVNMMNAVYFIRQDNPGCTKNWWFRHGTTEAGSSPTSVVNLITLLENKNMEVNAAFFWDGGHMADLDAPDCIKWINKLTGYSLPAGGDL